MAEEDKCKSPEDVDRIISAEIPDKETDPIGYEAVSQFMMHGPCGNAKLHSPCMKDGRCTKHFPKEFVSESHVDENGYPLYRRRDDGRKVEKGGIILDNRY